MFDVELNANVTYQFAYEGDNCYGDVLPDKLTLPTHSRPNEFNFLHISRHGIFLAPVGTHKTTEGTGGFSTG